MAALAGIGPELIASDGMQRDGHSMVPLLRHGCGAEAASLWPRPGVLTSTQVTNKLDMVHAVTNAAATHRLITYGDVHCDAAKKCCHGQMELYDLRTDLPEEHNLCAQSNLPNICGYGGCGGGAWPALKQMFAVREQLLSAPARAAAMAAAARDVWREAHTRRLTGSVEPWMEAEARSDADTGGSRAQHEPSTVDRVTDSSFPAFRATVFGRVGCASAVWCTRCSRGVRACTR